MSESKRETRKYIARGVNRCAFYVPVIDENGKPVPDIMGQNGQQRYVNNKPIFLEELEHFESTPIDKKKPLDRSCFYIVEENDPRYDAKVKALEALVMNPAHPALSEEEDSRKVNPEAYAEAKQRKKIEKELTENRKAAQEARAAKALLETELIKKDEVIVAAKEKLSEKDNELAKAKATMDALMKGNRPAK